MNMTQTLAFKKGDQVKVCIPGAIPGADWFFSSIGTLTVTLVRTMKKGNIRIQARSAKGGLWSFDPNELESA